MALQSNIYLIGLMGVGKSTIGKKLANRLGQNFIDCDQEIEKRNGVSVNTIFEIEGESGFRQRESKLLAELSASHAGIIATGGGVVMQTENRELLKNQDIVIYLNAPLNLLWSRLRFCKNRPLLQTRNPKARLSALLTERDPLYREVASHVITVNKGSASKIVKQIEDTLKETAA